MKLFIFDLDCTLIEGYWEKKGAKALPFERIALLPGREETIRRLAEQGALFSIVTNQAVVAFGYQTVAEVQAKIAGVLAALDFFYGAPVSVHVCYHHPHATVEEWRQDPCARRKPSPGMLNEAVDAHNWLLGESVFIGDMKTDREAAAAAGLTYVDEADFFDATYEFVSKERA